MLLHTHCCTYPTILIGGAENAVRLIDIDLCEYKESNLFRRKRCQIRRLLRNAGWLVISPGGLSGE